MWVRGGALLLWESAFVTLLQLPASRRLPWPVRRRSGHSRGEVQAMGSAGTTTPHRRRKSR